MVSLHSLEYWRAKRRIMKSCISFYLKTITVELEEYKKVLEVNCGVKNVGHDFNIFL